MPVNETEILPFGKHGENGDEGPTPMNELPTGYLQWLANQEPSHSNDFEVPDKYQQTAKKILLDRDEPIDPDGD